MVANVNVGGLSDFGEIAAINLPQMKFIFILTLYINFIEMKNQTNECTSVQCFPKSTNMHS